MRPAPLPLSHQRLGLLVLLLAAACASLLFDLRVVGLLVVYGGVWLAGWALAIAVVPDPLLLDRSLATVTLSMALVAVVAEGLSLLTLLGSTSAWIVAATVCGLAFGAVAGCAPHPRNPLPAAVERGDEASIPPLYRNGEGG